MKKVPNIEWNQNQLLIALELSKGKTPKEVFDDGQFTKTLIYKVAEVIEGGNKPPSLDEAYISTAPPPTKFGTGKKKKEKLGEEAPTTVLTGEEAPTTVVPKGVKGGAPLTDALSQTAFLQFIPQVQQLPLTPNIFISYMCAVKNGYQGAISDWLSLVSQDFWLGRDRDMFAEVSGVSSGNHEKEGGE